MLKICLLLSSFVSVAAFAIEPEPLFDGSGLVIQTMEGSLNDDGINEPEKLSLGELLTIGTLSVVEKARVNSEGKPLIKLIDLLIDVIGSEQSPLRFQEDAPRDEAAFCQEKVMAWVEPADNTFVHICQYGLSKALGNSKVLYQTLIHEYIHVLGVLDECETTDLEYQIMEASGLGVQYKSGYEEKCALN